MARGAIDERGGHTSPVRSESTLRTGSAGSGGIATLRRLLGLAGAPRLRVTLAVILGSLTVLFGVGLMAMAGYLIARAAERPAILALMTAIVAVRFFGIARPLARYGERLASHDVALRALARIRTRVYARIEPLAPAQLAGYAKGDLLARVVADVDAQQNLHLRGVIPPLVAVVAGTLSVAVAAAFLPMAGLALGIGLLVTALAVPAVTAQLARRVAQRQAASRGELSAELVELLGAAPEIVAYGGEAAALERIRATDGTLARIGRRDAFAAGVGDALELIVAGVTVAAVLALAIAAHAGGELDRVLIAMLALLALASFEAVQPLSAVARELPATLGAGRRLLDLIDREPVVTDPPVPAPAPAPPFAIAIENVRARYPVAERPPDRVPPGRDVAAREPTPERLALDGLSLRLEPGRRMAIIGASGAGKTTVVNLLLRFLDPEQGRVTLAGRDVRDYRQEDVRRAIAVAGQDSHLLSTSIRENVRLARPGADDPAIEQALRRARLWEWVRDLPQGLDTPVGETGRELSAGQRQRLVFARALLADAPILVLDEPTAHLDPPTAETLIRDVLSATGDRSVLVITHRPEGLDLVDDVVDLTAASA